MILNKDDYCTMRGQQNSPTATLPNQGKLDLAYLVPVTTVACLVSLEHLITARHCCLNSYASRPEILHLSSFSLQLLHRNCSRFQLCTIYLISAITVHMKNILRMVLQNIIKTSKEKSWLPEKTGRNSKNWTRDRVIKKKVGLLCFLLFAVKLGFRRNHKVLSTDFFSHGLECL